MKDNCVVVYFLDDRTCWWTGIGWSEERRKGKRMGISEAEELIEGMRRDDIFASWERFDAGRSAL